MSLHNRWLPLLAGLFIFGCSSPHVRVDAAGDEAAKCRSFGWLRPAQEPESLTDQRVRTATSEELRKKGYSMADEKPDCRVTYSLSTRQQPNSKPRVGVGVGGGSGGLGGGIGVSLPVGKRERVDGEFAISVIDAAKNAEIWHGAIDAAFGSEEISANEASAIVGQVLAKFPDASK